MDSAIELMLRVRADDRAAFAVLYERHSRRVHRFLQGLGSDPQTAHDLGQETFLRIWQHRARYAATGSFPAYLLTFARYVWLEHCRHRRRRGYGLVDELLDTVKATPAARPDERAFRMEIGDRVRAALSGLPEDQRMAFILQTIQGLSAEETASVMQCPVNTARSRKILAVKKLRVLLQPFWDTESSYIGDTQQ